jgi:hypothetical protein
MGKKIFDILYNITPKQGTQSQPKNIQKKERNRRKRERNRRKRESEERETEERQGDRETYRQKDMHTQRGGDFLEKVAGLGSGGEGSLHKEPALQA